MKLILTLSTSYSQYEGCSNSDIYHIKKTEKQIKHYRNDGFMRLSIGVFSHTMAHLHLISGPLSEPNVMNPYLLYNTIGITFDVFAIIQFTRARKLKRELNLYI